MSTKKLTVLIASATANTGSNTIRALHASGKVTIRGMARNLEKAKKMLGDLKGVTFVKGDFKDEKSIAAALEGVDRALLVTGAGTHEQFEWETNFIAAAQKAKVEGIVRISTATCLIHPGSTGVYARAHACIEAFIDAHKAPVVDLNPNWFLSNWYGSAGEAKQAGTITFPVKGDGKAAFIDTRDIGSAAALILESESKVFKTFLAERKIEIHGPKLTSFTEQAEILSKAVGYPIKINTIDGTKWRDIMVGFGLSKLFATSFLHTIQLCSGEREPLPGVPTPQVSSKILETVGWTAKHDVDSWASSKTTQAVFKK